MPQSPPSRRQHPHEKPPIAPGAESSDGSESGTELPLPHERDESPDTAVAPDPAIRQAHDDLAEGQVDTDMRTTPDFIMSQPRYTFAAHIRNVTPQAVSIPVKPASGYHELSDSDYEALLTRNRARISGADLPTQSPAPKRRVPSPAPAKADYEEEVERAPRIGFHMPGPKTDDDVFYDD